MVKKFIRKDINKKKRLPEKWRKPKGITNKMRLKHSGHSAHVRPGYGTKNSEKGKTIKGLRIIKVDTIEQLKKINPKTQAALLSGLGKRKKIELIAEAEKLNITLVNFNKEAYKTRAQKFLLEKKQDSAKRKETQLEAEQKAKDAAAQKEKDKDEKTAEEKRQSKALSAPEESEKKKAEKAEKDKILTKSK
jgi:large subunit ribosomal protein L32e